MTPQYPLLVIFRLKQVRYLNEKRRSVMVRLFYLLFKNKKKKLICFQYILVTLF
jgi:hypothetical protein